MNHLEEDGDDVASPDTTTCRWHQLDLNSKIELIGNTGGSLGKRSIELPGVFGSTASKTESKVLGLVRRQPFRIHPSVLLLTYFPAREKETIRKVTMVVPVLMTSCHVSEK